MMDDAMRIAREAGQMLLERFGRLAGNEIERIGRRDVVTAADRDAEAFILRELARATPDIPVLGEEEARARLGTGGRPGEATGPLWIVDPLDGTVNFVAGIPLFCVSIGLVEDGRPILGAIYAPAFDQLFHGAPGAGCFENGRPVSTSIAPVLEDAIVATGFAYRREEEDDDNLAKFVAIGRRVRGMRRLGASALDLAYVASGRLDGFWELGLAPWDVAAGAALIRAAGGTVTDLEGGPNWLYGRRILATNGLLHADLGATLAAAAPGAGGRAS